MSNPFLTNDSSDDIKAVSPFNVFDVTAKESDNLPSIVGKKSNNPFMTCDDDVATNLFDSADSGIHSKDLFVSSDDVSSADLFGTATINSATIVSNSPGDPFGPVEQDDLTTGVEPSSNRLRIDVSKLDFFNTKGAVSPGVSPRHSPILEEKDFVPAPPIDASFLSDITSDNASEDSLSLHETDAVIEASIAQPQTTADNPFNTSVVLSESDAGPKEVPLVNGNIGDIPSIELTSSDNPPVLTADSAETPDEVRAPDNDDVFIGNGVDWMSNQDSSNVDAAKEPEPVAADAGANFEAAFTSNEAFDAFAAKFESASVATENSKNLIDDAFDPFSCSSTTTNQLVDTGQGVSTGFDEGNAFDPFLAMGKPPKNTPIKLLQLDDNVKDSFDDDDGTDEFAVVIRPKMRDLDSSSKRDEPPVIMPLLPPPPKAPIQVTPPESPVQSRFNPFNKESVVEAVEDIKDEALVIVPDETKKMARTESEDSGMFTPLYDDDTSQPLEDFPPKFEGDGWELMLRQPTKKKITGNRFWKKIFVRIKENSVLMLYNTKDDNDPFQELPLQACYSLSDPSAQQYDAYGKIFTVKLQYVFYREKVGMRPGQISKVVQGQITSVGQLAKLGLPLEHSPQVSQLLKLGSQNYKELQTFVMCVEDALFHLSAHRDRALQYKSEEIQVFVYDEFYAEINIAGKVTLQQARVRLFFLAFIGGMPDVEVGLNDLEREGKEVVGRHDIIPVVTEEWIRLENCEFHSCVSVAEFEKTKTVKLRPPDACLFELMRFRIRPPRNRELPLHLKVSFSVSGSKVEIRGEVLVPGYHSRKHGQVPCEDVCIRIPMPECWIYLFRVEKHFRYGSLKSAHRKAGKIKGLERIIGAGVTLDQSLIEVSTGQAKYEHAHNAIVWRMQRLPKEGQGAYSTHLMLCRLELTTFDQMPDNLEKYCDVEYVMPASTVSHTTVRSVSVSNQNPPEKCVKYLARYKYQVEIDHNQGKGPCEYAAVTNKPTIDEEDEEQAKEPANKDATASDSSDDDASS